jgi:hypothetical protein
MVLDEPSSSCGLWVVSVGWICPKFLGYECNANIPKTDLDTIESQ